MENMYFDERKYVEKINKEYSVKEISKIEKLKKLDVKAKLGAKVFAYIFGSIGSLVLGFGMSVAMQVILAELMWLGIIVGIIGIFMVTINYFIYKKLLNKGKNKYANQILKLSSELLSEAND